MSRHNFSYINQFQRNGHAVLSKSGKTSETEWISNGLYAQKGVFETTKIDCDSDIRTHFIMHQPRNTGKSFSLKECRDGIEKAMYIALLDKYPLPPQGPALFQEKGTIPLGKGPIFLYGNPNSKYVDLRLFDGMIIRWEEREFLEKWIKSASTWS